MEIGTIFTLEQYADAYGFVREHKGCFIKEIEPVDGVRQFQVMEVPAPTQEEINQARIAELKQKLADSDYAIIKIAEGAATVEQYAELIEQRKAWRAEINTLEEE